MINIHIKSFKLLKLYTEFIYAEFYKKKKKKKYLKNKKKLINNYWLNFK